MARILIADDDELIAELASEVLIDAGHACGWVTSSEAAWNVLHRGRRPDVVLLDQDMPGMSGVTLLRRLRGSPVFYDLPIIMFTAMRGDEDEAQAIYAGAQDFIRKPFEPQRLTHRVERVLEKRGRTPRHQDLKAWLAERNGMAGSGDIHERRMV
ncbi:PleD family two-component system response regulator [Erythrobacter sp. JK5]|uniref:response regulator n=1 Tax=Erythrobacter sp. JK5 TaxID=2829500 RepID=UPI001BA88B9C|nr:response regulator [Erythrobacter sp. JK5]QUL38966.1 response regulator [Erythrobacter sp. JK5]